MDNIIVKIKIQGKEYQLKQSFRALMMFEEMTSKSAEQVNENVTDLMKLFYCLLKASNKETFAYDFDAFIDAIDEDPQAIEVFTDYLQKQQQTHDTGKKKAVKKQ